MDVANLREQIPACQKMVYVNTGWSGPSPVSVVQAITGRLDYEMEMGPTSPEVYLSGKEIYENTRKAVAGLLNASTDELCLTENTTDGLNMVMNGLKWSQGDEIITCNLEHSSVLIPSYYKQHRYGAVVKVLSLAYNEQWESILDKVEAAITDRTRLIFLSHIQYSCGLRMPVKEIRKLTKGRDILMLLDGAQTAGHISLDMKDIDCDFYSIPGQKWLLGSEGIGALYVRRELVPQLEPMKVAGWSALSQGDPYVFEPNTGSMDKFLGTSASAALRAGMLEAIGFIRGIGAEEIERRNLTLASSLKQALQEIPGVKVLTPMNEHSASGLVSFAVDGVDPKTVVSRFWDQHRILVRSVEFPSCVRVSLHFFNTEDEVNKVVEAVRQLV